MVRKFNLLRIFSIPLFLIFSGNARADSSLLMAAIGDSMSAGYLSEAPGPDYDVLTFERQPSGGSVVLPDWSFFGVTGIDGRYTESWTTGKFISSHSVRLSDYLKSQGVTSPLKIANFSADGAKTDAMKNQAHRLAELFSSGNYSSLEYVTVQFGADDVCAGWDGPIVHQNMMEGFAALASIHQENPIKVLVASVPRISDLGEDRFVTSKTVLGMSCHEIRDIRLRYCPLQTVWSTEEEHKARLKIVDDVNSEIRAAVQEANLKFSNLEVIYSPSVAMAQNKIEYLALDCFHPNRLGQEMVSRVLWADQPWFR